jgi:hypothetical protein
MRESTGLLRNESEENDRACAWEGQYARLRVRDGEQGMTLPHGVWAILRVMQREEVCRHDDEEEVS